ncbi:hypothetical protein [Paenibacillus sp. sgz500958]|uniref:hypothetical protein n=1 Tax=Paenibacillus sp. sgz500958 TaxID=3242475 RepID=UPI0036D2D05A
MQSFACPYGGAWPGQSAEALLPRKARTALAAAIRWLERERGMERDFGTGEASAFAFMVGFLPRTAV